MKFLNLRTVYLNVYVIGNGHNFVILRRYTPLAVLIDATRAMLSLPGNTSTITPKGHLAQVVAVSIRRTTIPGFN